MLIKRLVCSGALIALTIGFQVFVQPAVFACDVPVFRYILERWPTETFQMVVFHRGLMSTGGQVRWNGTDENGDQVASGVYYYRMVTGRFTQT